MAFEIDAKGTCKIEGVEYPAVGFGTYRLKNDICLKAVSEAVELGYRILDTATFYRNFIPISQVLQKNGRDKFYVISKVWPTAHIPELLREDIKMTLKELQTDYLDAYLLHWPNSEVSIEDTLHAMDELRMKGIIRHIGLSNVTINHLKRALEVNVPITWVQIEMHPLFYDQELVEFCRGNSIGVQAWAPLGRGRIAEDASLKVLGKKYNKTAAQIALRWILQHGCMPLPCSTNAKHMMQNLDIMDFSLSQEEMKGIDERAVNGQRERVSDRTGFWDEFDFSYEECWPKPKGQ